MIVAGAAGFLLGGAGVAAVATVFALAASRLNRFVRTLP
jgi:hypothetical protein